MTRNRLPDRRFKFGQELPALGHDVAVDVGFDGAGRAREIFVDGLKIGSELRALTTHASIVVSLLLQHGITAAELLQRIGASALADPDSAAEGHSILSRALAVAVRLEAEEGPALRAAHIAMRRSS
jgi:hypothetical protein